MSGSHGLRLDELTVGYRAGRRRVTPVLSGQVAQATRGELTVLLGPNGVGKSTLLRTVAGLQPPLGGTVTLDGADLPRMRSADRAQQLAVVLTERVEAGLLSARELVELGRHPHTGSGGFLRAEDHAAVDAAITAVDADHLAARRVTELSDGERQRVLTARALAQHPSALLLDEPAAFLDATSRVELLGLLRRLAREHDLCVLLSTHDLELALRLADHVWLIDRSGRLHTGGPEQLIADGAVATVFDTADLAFDPRSGGFVLTGPVTGSAHVDAPPDLAPLVTRTLHRQGWTVVGADPEDPGLAGPGPAGRGSDVGAGGSGSADVAVSSTGSGFLAGVDGRATHLAGWSELARWAREYRDRRPPGGWPLYRAAAPEVVGCLRAAASVGAWFAVESGRDDADPAGWWPLPELYRGVDGPLGGVLESVGRRLGSDEPRVAVSVFQLGLAARLASPMLAAAARGILLDLDPDDLAVQNRFGEAAGLRSARPGGWGGAGRLSAGELADRIGERLLDAHLAPMIDALRRISPVAPGLLWGNAASALVGALRVLETHLGPDAAGRVRAVVEHLLARPPLAGTGALAAPGTTPPFRRRSCCLYYRTAAGGHCSDCALGEDPPGRSAARAPGSAPGPP